MASLLLTKLLIRTGLARLLPWTRRLPDCPAAFLHYYSDRILAAPHADLAEVRSLLEGQGPDTIDLAACTPRFDLLPSTSTKLPAERRGYPPAWGLPELRQAVADILASEQSLEVRPSDEVLITHGAAGAFTQVLDTFVNPGDRVVLFDPTSPLYPLGLRQRRARICWVPTRVQDGQVRFRLDDVARAVRGARLLVLACPVNPTGAIFAREQLEQIAWWAGRHDVLLFSDRTFVRFRYEGEAASLGSLPRARQRTLTAGSVSKGQGLASARVGWLAGHRHLVGACAVSAALQAPFVPTLCQQLACAALRQDPKLFAPVLTEFAARRRSTSERLRKLGLEAFWPAGGVFFWASVRQLGVDGTTFARQLLATKKVAVWPGHFFGPSGSEHVRISYAADEGRLREGLSRLAEFVRQAPQDGDSQARSASVEPVGVGGIVSVQVP